MTTRTTGSRAVIDLDAHRLHRDAEAAGSRILEQLLAEAAEFFAAFDWATRDA